jgi:hypothetical protein
LNGTLKSFHLPIDVEHSIVLARSKVDTLKLACLIQETHDGKMKLLTRFAKLNYKTRLIVITPEATHVQQLFEVAPILVYFS